MHRKSLISQYLKVQIPALAGAIFAAFLLASPAVAQTEKPSLPDPVKFLQKYDITWRAVRMVLTDMGYEIELEDRTGGKITTRPYEFITGALTSTEVNKVAIKNDTITASWLKGRYTVEASFDVVSPTETMVTVRTNIEALSRDIDGSEKWVPLQSLGTLERRILGKISLKLLGDDLNFKEKKGFWDKSPQPIQKPNPYPTGPPEQSAL